MELCLVIYIVTISYIIGTEILTLNCLRSKSKQLGVYCLFVEFLHDLRMSSLACLGIPLPLSAFLICENTQGSSL